MSPAAAEKVNVVTVDYYAATTYRCRGLPADLRAAIFSVGRIAGRAAHATENYREHRLTQPEPDKTARLTLASGAVYDLRFEGIPQADGGGNPLIGTADVNGDGCADAIITVGRGASTTWTAFLIFDGARLLEADEAGKPAIFLFDGSIRHGDAIECRR